MIYQLVRQFFSPDDTLTDQRKVRANLLVRMRAFAGSFQALALFPGIYYRYIPQEYTLHFVLVVVFLSLFNAWSFVHFQKEGTCTDRGIFIQLLVDLLALTGLLFFSGGWNNPFIALFYFHACIGPFLLPFRYGCALFVALVLCITACFQLSCTAGVRFWQVNLPKNMILAAELFIAFILWIFCVWIAGSLDRLQTNIRVLRERNARFDRLRAVGALAAGFSHQLATPLNNIGLRMERLHRRHPELKEDADLSSVNSSVDQCHRVFRDFFAETPDDRHIPMQKTGVQEFLKTVCEAWVSENQPVLFRFQLCQAPVTGMLPRLSMTRTVMDLLDNARESQKGVPVIVINLKPDSGSGFYTLTIEDEGPGFSQELQGRVGEPFVTTKRDGTGLGLFTASGLIHSLSGELQTANRPGGGARVEIRLPVSETEEPDDTGPEENSDCRG